MHSSEKDVVWKTLCSTIHNEAENVDKWGSCRLARCRLEVLLSWPALKAVVSCFHLCCLVWYWLLWLAFSGSSPVCGVKVAVNLLTKYWRWASQRMASRTSTATKTSSSLPCVCLGGFSVGQTRQTHQTQTTDRREEFTRHRLTTTQPPDTDLHPHAQPNQNHLQTT